LILTPNGSHDQTLDTTLQRRYQATITPDSTALLGLAATNFGMEDGCRCRKLTVNLFEELCAESTNSNQATMDVLLRYFRDALMKCNTILDCDQCNTSISESSSNMLLAMAGQHMSTICERIAVCYASMRRRDEARQRSLAAHLEWHNGMTFGESEEWHSSGDGSAAVGDMWFSTYQIRSSHERMQVLRCLVIVQLTDFSHLMERLKKRTGNQSGCLVLLTDAEKRIISTKSILLGHTKAASSRVFSPS
jgi:hypothetical protein